MIQVESLKNRCELQELELQQSAKKAQEAMTLAADESAKCKAAKEVIKSLTAQVMFGSYLYVPSLSHNNLKSSQAKETFRWYFSLINDFCVCA